VAIITKAGGREIWWRALSAILVIWYPGAVVAFHNLTNPSPDVNVIFFSLKLNRTRRKYDVANASVRHRQVIVWCPAEINHLEANTTNWNLLAPIGSVKPIFRVADSSECFSCGM